MGPHTASSNAHLAGAAPLPTLLLTRFQHLKEAQESPEVNGRRVLELGQSAEVEKRPEALQEDEGRGEMGRCPT